MIRAGTQTIETPRLILRRFTREDAGDMYTCWASDEEVTRFLTWPPHSSGEATAMLLDAWTARYQDGGYFNWAIEWRETGRVIGNISAVRLEEAIDSAEIGYCMGRAYWGRGIMTEVLRHVIAFLFEKAALQRIWAGHDTLNPRSGRVMAKAGMRPEGVLRRGGRNNRGLVDVAIWSILREEWAEQAQAEKRPVTVRPARAEDLEAVNVLRRQVNALHAAGKPEVFKSGFSDELRDHVRTDLTDPLRGLAVAERDGKIVGYACLRRITRPETPCMHERDYLDIDEFGVDEGCRRQGVGTALVRFIRACAADRGIKRIESNMWEFNGTALRFYEAAGFETYRRYMEMKIK